MEPIKIQVEVSLSEKTMNFLRPLVQELIDMPRDVYDGTRAVKEETAKKPAEAPAAPAPKANPAPEAKAPQAAAEEPAPEPEAAVPTTEDVREAMYAVRRRIEGEDWQENKSSDGYKTYHKALTALFKDAASECSKGATDKPSALAESSRGAFIELCKDIHVKPDGKLSEIFPF